MDSHGHQSFNIKDCMLDTTRTNSPGLVDIVILNYVLTFVCIYFAKYVIFFSIHMTTSIVQLLRLFMEDVFFFP